MKTAIQILDAMIEELNPKGFIPSNTDSIVTSYLGEAKERIKKELSTESNERYNVFPNYSEILSLTNEKEGGACFISKVTKK